MRFYRVLSPLALAGVFLLGALDPAQAQRGDFRFPGGGRNRMRDMPMPAPTEQKPADEKKDEKSDEKKDDEKKPEEKKDDGPAPVQRPTDPERPANPGELAVKPADDGKISFSFKGQPWPAVLEWLADVSNMSLEWEEAPAGYLDLTTRGRYTVDEVRDLLNSVLLNKGFTVLRNGEVLIVANLKKLDGSLVPRVTPSELDQRGTYELARTFFDLDWLIAEQAAKEIEPLLSPFGKATPLKATNRLDVLDTAGNLRRVRELLAEEQSDAGQQRLVREFKLRFTRADEVLDTLNLLLGIEPKQQAANPVDPRQLMQAMMMAQQAGGQAGMGQAGKKETNIFLAVNARENSILANAPPDKMGVIEQAIEAVDVPKARGRGMMADSQKFKVYRLSGLQPDTLAKVLKDLGSLDPTTKLEVDTKKNALIVYGPLVDHLLVTDLVERLDGTSRKFEVIQLRTLSAEYVAGSILTLVNGPEKQQEQRPRWMYFDSGSQQTQDNADKFWVEADVERNRLLLRANEVELAEVRALLVKLGEIPADQRFGNTTRVVPAAAGQEMKDALERAKRLWQSVSPNPLEIEIDPRMLEPARRRPKPADEAANARRRSAPTDARELTPSGSREGQPRGGQPRPNQGRGNRAANRAAPAGRFRLAQDRLEPKVTRQEAADNEGKASDEVAEEVGDDSDTPDKAVVTESGEANVENDGQTNDTSDEIRDESDRSVMEPNDGVDEDAGEEPAEPAASTDAESEPPTGPGDLPRRAHAPIKITLGPQGLVISSSDTDALDRLEELLTNVMPPRTNYEIFTLKHTYAKDMVLLLKDIFKADMGKDSNSRSEVFDMFWNGYGRSSNQQTRNTLSKRRPLSFVSDPVTNTVLVQGADAAQLTEIEELIERYDRAEPPNSESVRRTTRVPLRYAKAKEVADVIKDVYRDLLSPNDKALVANQPQQQQGREQRGNDNFYSAMFSYLTDDPTKSEIVPRFKGMLSVGIDERANGVVISAPQIILTEVLKMVRDLDADARPSRGVVRVLKVRNPGVGTQLEQAVAAKKAGTAPAPDTAAGGTVTANPNAGKVQTERIPGGVRVGVSR